MTTGKRSASIGWCVAFGSLLVSGVVQGQRAGTSPRWGVGAGAGMIFPLGSFSTTDNPGADVLMYFSYALDPTFSLGLDVGAAWTPHKQSGHSELYDVLLDVAWRPSMTSAAVRPFLLGSVGSVVVDFNDPDRGRPALGGGGAVSFGRRDVRVFVLARYLHVFDRRGALNVVPLTVGFATRAP